MTQIAHVFTDCSEVAELETLLDFLRWGVGRFEQAQLHYGHGTDNAWDEAVALILHTLYLPHDVTPQVLQSRLTRAEKTAIYAVLRKRVEERVPVPYITHQAWFMNLSFYVDERVLIPRSPFGELIAQQFNPWIDAEQVQSVLDVCTGSGCMAIACAYLFPDAGVDAVDISSDALAVATKNIAQHAVGDQVTLYQSDVFTDLPLKQYDIIISNPPYVSDQEMRTLPAEFTHEPSLALAAPDEGLAIVTVLLKTAAQYMTQEACLFVEVGLSGQEALSARYPTVPFVWLEMQHGGEGIFMLTREQLEHYHPTF